MAIPVNEILTGLAIFLTVCTGFWVANGFYNMIHGIWYDPYLNRGEHWNTLPKDVQVRLFHENRTLEKAKDDWNKLVDNEIARKARDASDEVEKVKKFEEAVARDRKKVD